MNEEIQYDSSLFDKFKIIFSDDLNDIETKLPEYKKYFNVKDGILIFKLASLKQLETDIQNFVKTWINQFRYIWHDTLPGKKGDKNSCVVKMTDFLINTKFEYSIETIIEMAKLYVYDCNNYRYLQQADYFIYKTTSGIQQSRLLAYLEDEDTRSTEVFHGDSII